MGKKGACDGGAEWGRGRGGGNPTPASVLPGCSHIISHHPFPLKRGSNALKPTQPSFSYSLCLLTNGNLKHGPLQLCHRDKDFVIKVSVKLSNDIVLWIKLQKRFKPYS